MASSSDKDSENRVRFGGLLAEALKRQGMRQDDLARSLGTTQSSVSGWINGKYEPAAATVFAVEGVLGLEPGHLSRPLGYLPADPGAGPRSVESAIAQSTVLDEDEKAALLNMYQVLMNRHHVRTVADGEARVRKPARKARLGAAGATPSRPRSVAGSR